MTVSPSSIAVALGRSTPSAPEAEQWAFWIEAAQILIRARLGDLAALDQAVLDYVVTEAVVAQVRRPDDVTQVDVSVDDGRTSRRYSSSRGRVTILDEWWDLLAPGATASGAFTISPSFTPGVRGDRW